MVERPDDQEGLLVADVTGEEETKIVADIIGDFRAKMEYGGAPDIRESSEKLRLSVPELNEKELALLLGSRDPETIDSLYGLARKQRESLFGRNIFVRAVIEISNYCRRDCRFCGNAVSGKGLSRYRVGPQEVIEQATKAKEEGVDLIHLASGEDMGIGKEVLVEMIRAINRELGCTVELAIGDRPVNEYEEFYAAGARRAILKFETSNAQVFAEMKPRESLEERLLMLLKLRKIGYRIGSGNMIGLPGQDMLDVAHDLISTTNLKTELASTSVFVPNRESALWGFQPGDRQTGLNYIALLRILSGDRRVSIPTNSTLGETGKYKALEIGALELSLNMTPSDKQNRYSLYGGKDRFRAGMDEIKGKVEALGYKVESFSKMKL